MTDPHRDHADPSTSPVHFNDTEEGTSVTRVTFTDGSCFDDNVMDGATDEFWNAASR